MRLQLTGERRSCGKPSALNTFMALLMCGSPLLSTAGFRGVFQNVGYRDVLEIDTVPV